MTAGQGEARWLEMLETIEALVDEIQSQLGSLAPGETPSPHAAAISRNLFKVAEVLALVVTSASRQVVAMDDGHSQRQFAAGILERMSRIRKSMEQVNGRLAGIQGLERLPEISIPTCLN